MGRLDGKVAIVTGGGSGIGRAAAIIFAKEGAKVVVACRTVGSGQEVVSKIEEAGGEAVFVKTDVSRASDAENLVKAAINTYGQLHVLFNNAGTSEPRNIKTADLKEEDADRIIAINLKGVFLVTKYAIPEMIKSGGGSIICTASECAIHSCHGLSIYSATKGAVLSFSRVVAMEYARDGIRCNTICPGLTRTPLHAELQKSSFWEKMKENVPLGKSAEPEDIAYVALFLASDESNFVTGANLMADGGTTVKGVWVPV
jgi:NAD(P)-dependent dehydrogenase (short-subunit alcohol dehydrogenase family)